MAAEQSTRVSKVCVCVCVAELADTQRPFLHGKESYGEVSKSCMEALRCTSEIQLVIRGWKESGNCVSGSDSSGRVNSIDCFR